MRYRIEYGWGDRQQSLFAHFEAENDDHARQIAVSLLRRIQINGAWLVHDNTEGRAAETQTSPLGRPVDHTRWLEAGP